MAYSFGVVARNQCMTENFLLDNIDQITFDVISVYQKLSEDFLDRFSNRVHWFKVSLYQKLSEEFIEKYKHKVHWENIVKAQTLSESFIVRHLEFFQQRKLLDIIANYQVLSEEFRAEHNLSISQHNWLYLDNAQKLELISNNYEIVDGKVIAYKAARSDGHSVFNFHYKYDIGGEYECHADCNSNEENSFGLSAWTKDGALSYYHSGKLFKVEIDLADIACMTKKNKLRARKLRIIGELQNGTNV